ncbi:MAG: hypothetical protein AAEI92_11030 [Arenicellales bacterium]
MPTKSYIWGMILGIGLVLEGATVILLSQNWSPLHYALMGEYEIVDKLLSTINQYAFPMGGFEVFVGVLIAYRKAIGWYLLYLTLIVMGIGALVFVATNLSEEWLILAICFAFSLFCLVFLWLQLKYWRSRA